MKTLLIIIAFLCSINGQAQTSIKTATISVKGNCDQCKERIENAADIKGVKTCVWNEKTKVATIVFDTKKTTLELIEKAIAKAGHETSSQKVEDNAYNALPDCCKYKSTDCKKK
jgi:copper chaperone CopZ